MTLLLADEQYSLKLVERFREEGLDVITINDLGKDDQRFPDNEVLDLAHRLGRAFITFNRKDFKRLHREGATHSGIIVCKNNTPHELLISKVVALATSDVDLAGTVFAIVQP